MATTPPTFDAAAVATDLATHLDQHRAAVAPTIAAPSSDPMFTQHADGTILDRAGRVLVHGAVPSPSTASEVKNDSSNRP